MASKNTVYLFRNGIADFRRAHQVSGVSGANISIPVKQDQVADVLASLDCFGDVKLTKPPSYSSSDTSSTLSIDSNDPMGSALSQFSGAKVALDLANGGRVEGVLVGVEVNNSVTPMGVSVPEKRVSILAVEGLKQYCLDGDITTVKFLEETDRAEFEKALSKNYQKIKPGSTFINLSLASKTGKDVEAFIQYALPVASWNMSYRLKRDESNRWKLDGHAVVHNSTDFDWKDYLISVVTGTPTTFEQDLADAKRPLRSRVNVTDERAHGAVHYEGGYGARGAQGAQGSMGPQGVSSRAMMKTMSSPTVSATVMSFGGGNYESMDASELESVGYGQAEMDLADASTVGDYLVLTSTCLSDILENESALVPMFSKDLAEAERVFYYKPSNDPSFPFSSIKFKNTTDMPLTRGVCTVVIEGHNAGMSVLEAAKPGDTRLVSHSLETGIRIVREPAEMDTPVSLIRINEGNLYTSRRAISSQDYIIKNKLDEEAVLVLEHDWNIQMSDVSATLNGQAVTTFEKISTGVRFTIKVPSKTDNIKFVVKENKIQESTQILNGNQFKWVAQQGWFDNDEAFSRVSTIQEECNRLGAEKNELVQKRNELTADQNRYNGLLPNATTNKVRFEEAIGKAEDELVQLNQKEIPAKDKAIAEATARLSSALRKLRVEVSPKSEAA